MKTFLFDLDGTLLPMDQDVFVKYYFGLLCKKLPGVFEPEKLIKVIWKSTGAMVQNDGSVTNEKVFWKVFDAAFEMDSTPYRPIFDEFYKEEFNQAKVSCGFNPYANKIIKYLKEKGYRVVLATNPIFPRMGTMNRIRWAGVDPEDFELITTFEDCHSCKPNLRYYEEILAKIGEKAENCIMVGNDLGEDMVVNKLGMEFILDTDCLINKENVTPECIFAGSLEEIYKMLIEKY